VDATLVGFLEKVAKFGEDNDARETARPKRMLNITATRAVCSGSSSGRWAPPGYWRGTSNAFSTMWLADAARSTGGRVTTLELNPEKIALARANLATAGLDGVVDIIEGRAADTLAALPGPLDLVFFDADRASYLAYLELVVPKLRSGGMLIADNVTSHAQELQDYLRRVKDHPQLFTVTVPIGNGEEITMKMGDGT